MGIFARSGRSLAVLGVVALGSFILAAPQSSAEDPPGNNGTIKIDGVLFGDVPNNEPHPGCIFQVDFYGYDFGLDKNATVTFYVWPPTGDREQLHQDTVFIGEDSNAGGGSTEGLDATATYDLAPLLKTYMADTQGFHIKLKVNAPGSKGKDTKFKVFWVEECAYGAAA